MFSAANILNALDQIIEGALQVLSEEILALAASEGGGASGFQKQFEVWGQMALSSRLPPIPSSNLGHRGRASH